MRVSGHIQVESSWVAEMETRGWELGVGGSSVGSDWVSEHEERKVSILTGKKREDIPFHVCNNGMFLTVEVNASNSASNVIPSMSKFSIRTSSLGRVDMAWKRVNFTLKRIYDITSPADNYKSNGTRQE